MTECEIIFVISDFPNGLPKRTKNIYAFRDISLPGYVAGYLRS